MKYEIYRCHKCKKQLTEDLMGKKCVYCGEWQYKHLALIEIEAKEERKKIIHCSDCEFSGLTDEAFARHSCNDYKSNKKEE